MSLQSRTGSRLPPDGDSSHYCNIAHQLTDQPHVSIADRNDLNRSRIRPGIPKSERQHLLWKHPPAMISPLDCRHSIPLQIFIQSQACKCLGGLDSIQVDMVEGKAATVVMHDRKGRTAHVRRRVDAKPVGQSPDEERFPCSELTDERDHVPGIRKLANGLPQRERLLG